MTPLIFSQPQVPPQKNLPKKTKDPPPRFPHTVELSMAAKKWGSGVHKAK